jgi:UDP-N-acetylmuramoyl-tripeptide--D-alanyl-D-alanine ligase
VRGAARWIVEEAVRAGMPPEAAHFFEDPTEAGEFIRQLAAPGDAILFKGSRGVEIERAMEKLLA